MVEASELRAIREELQMLRFLYKKIAEQHIPVEEPSPGDVEAIECAEEAVGLVEVRGLLERRGKVHRGSCWF